MAARGPDQRRTPPRGPRPPGGRGLGRSGGDVAGGAPGKGGDRPPRPRLTGRAAVLVLVLALLAVSYTSSLRAYLEQRAHIEDLQQTISTRQEQISELQREKQRWRNPEYVRAQARDRLGYVMPGETPFVVLDEDGEPLQPESSLSDPDRDDERVPPAWWDHTWRSVLVAGDPDERADPPPARRITDPEGAPKEGE